VDSFGNGYINKAECTIVGLYHLLDKEGIVKTGECLFYIGKWPFKNEELIKF
jgi:hypothetical protein